MDTIYLDNNATTAVLPEVAAAMEPFGGERYGNPSSRHSAGRKARRALEEARECVAAYLGAEPEEVIFTSGGTEANYLAIFGLAGEGTGLAITSTIEHPSISGCFDALERRGWEVKRLGVDRRGIVLADEFETCSAPRGTLVSVMLANNETGAIQPVRELAESARRQGMAFHTDAVQAIGKIPVSFHEWGVATLSVAAHKFHGPKGVGALLVRKGVDLHRVFPGGHQQGSVRPGTEPVALAVGMAKALALACSQLEERREHLQRCTARLFAKLTETIPDVVLNGPSDALRLPNTLNVSFPGIDAQGLQMALDLEGVCCSVGSACASGSTQPSPVLTAMGLDADRSQSAVRLSVGMLNREHEMDEAARRTARCVDRLRDGAAASGRDALVRQR
jgi:cysteine desulfurase